MSNEPRIIKRYSNRKLYDLVDSKYITLPDVDRMVREGIDIKIIDNKTKEDITSVTLAQLLYEQQKKKRGAVPLAVFKEFVQTGRAALDKHLSTPVVALRNEAEKTIQQLKDEAERRVSSLKETAERRVREMLHEKPEGEGPGEGNAPDEGSHSTKMLLDEWTRAFDERLRSLLGAHGALNTTADASIQARLEQIEQTLAGLHDRLSQIEAAFQGKSRD